MKILAIGGSNSKNSINRKLANFTAQLLENAEVIKVDVSELDIPIYSVDIENEIGIPAEVYTFSYLIDDSELIIISLAENNGSFNVGFKNLLDWTSRIKDRKTFNNKKMLLMSTSPGARGGASALQHGMNVFPHSGADIIASYSLPNFYQNFDDVNGITNSDELRQLKEIISRFTS
jgi:NAD(P)H-dependent FMN reductase